MGLIKIKNRKLTLDYYELDYAIYEMIGKYPANFYYQKPSHFDKWRMEKGYSEIDPEGRQSTSSRIYSEEYSDDPEGLAKCPLHCNFNSLWYEIAGVDITDRKKTHVFTEIHDKFRERNGKPTAAQTTDHQRMVDLINSQQDVQERHRASQMLSELRSYRAKFELDWTEEIFEAIYTLIGYSKSKPIVVTY